MPSPDGAVEREIGPEDVAQHEVVVCSHHRLGTRDRIAGKRRQTLDYLVEEGYTLLVAGIDGSSPAVYK